MQKSKTGTFLVLEVPKKLYDSIEGQHVNKSVSNTKYIIGGKEEAEYLGELLGVDAKDLMGMPIVKVTAYQKCAKCTRTLCRLCEHPQEESP